MTYKKILPRFIMALMSVVAVTLPSCSDNDEPDSSERGIIKIEKTARFSDRDAAIELSAYGIDLSEIVKADYNLKETGSFTTVNDKPVLSPGNLPDPEWLTAGVDKQFECIYCEFSPNLDETHHRYAIFEMKLTKDDGSRVVVNVTLYQEGKDTTLPAGVDRSYTMRISVVADDGSDLLDPAHPYTIWGKEHGLGIDISGEWPDFCLKAEAPLIDEATGRRYIPVERTFAPESLNLPEKQRISWGLFANKAVVVVSEADTEGQRTYTIDGGEPKPLEKDGLITLVTPPAESLHYKPLAIPIKVLDVNGNPTDRLYLTATGADGVEHTAPAIPGNPVYSRQPAPGGSIWPELLADDEPEITYYGLFVPYDLLDIYGSRPIEYKKGSLYALGEYDSTKPFEETFTIRLKTKDGDWTHGTYTLRIVNEVSRVANYKKSSTTVYINDAPTGISSSDYITLAEQASTD